MLELSRSTDEEVGDGTTSVIILAGELMHAALPLLERGLHPSVIVSGYARALDAALDIARGMAHRVDLTSRS